MALIAGLTTVWQAQLEKYLLVEPVFEATLCNRNYEGNLKSNKTLKIVSVSRMVANPYVSSDPWNWQKISTSDQTFQADQIYDVHAEIEALDQYGSALRLLDETARESALALRKQQDTYIASLHTNVLTNRYGTDAAPITVGFNTAAGEILPSVALTQLMELAAENNANMSNFNTVVPVWLAAFLNQELGTRFTSVGDSALAAGVEQGVPMSLAVGGYKKIVPSNNVYNTGGNLYKVMAGTPANSITFAEALVVAETGKIIEGYGDFIKTLQVYGGTIPVEGHMALGTFNRGTARQ